jgi:hypothetical protein
MQDGLRIGAKLQKAAMDGLEFVRGNYLSIAEGCYLPYADLQGLIQARLHESIYKNPQVKQYVPNLLDVDIFVTWDDDQFMLFVSPEKRAHLPTRGMETKHLAKLRADGSFTLQQMPPGYHDISDASFTKDVFKELGFAAGFAATGTFPSTSYDDESKAKKQAAGVAIAQLLINWAQNRRHAMENSRIFLSHKGANKPLIGKVDQTLRLLGLKTWFDRDDLAAGDTLVRGVDNAFAECSAAVFFLSGQFADAGVIQREIDRAIHEQAMRADGFKVIPIVLAQHGGSDDLVPKPLQTLVWKTVDDIDILPTILRALPDFVKAQIKYSPHK